MPDDINQWLENFKRNWKQKNVDKVLELFSPEVEYHETPTRKLETREEIREEWEGIREQEDIKLDLEVWSKDENKYTVKWHLEYTQNSERKLLNGIYLIKLNKKAKCTEFWQYCQIE